MFELTNGLLIKILLFVIVLFISFEVSMKIFKDRKTSAIISVIITAISLFYINTYQELFLFKSYGLLGSIFIFLIPLIIILYSVYASNIGKVTRRALWIFYSIIMISFLYWNENLSQDTTINLSLLFLLIISLILIFDKKIKEFLNRRGI